MTDSPPPDSPPPDSPPTDSPPTDSPPTDSASEGSAPAEVLLYTTPWCPYCVAARRLFDEKGVAYRDIDVSGDAEARAWLREKTGQRKVPQVFIAGTPHGGFTDVERLDRRGELDVLLRGR
ncbi:MAG: glutaredoxin domain-containing protein [Myxococcota bacterium]